MVGDSMTPWRKPGELVLCYRAREPIVGNHVVAVLKDEDHDGSNLSAVGVLVSHDDNEVVVQQYSPSDVLRFAAGAVAFLFRVIEWQDAFGLLA
jgi:phage repressor protein C with HTH and peptisase S24 domain